MKLKIFVLVILNVHYAIGQFLDIGDANQASNPDPDLSTPSPKQDGYYPIFPYPGRMENGAGSHKTEPKPNILGVPPEPDKTPYTVPIKKSKTQLYLYPSNTHIVPEDDTQGTYPYPRGRGLVTPPPLFTKSVRTKIIGHGQPNNFYPYPHPHPGVANTRKPHLYPYKPYPPQNIETTSDANSLPKIGGNLPKRPETYALLNPQGDSPQNIDSKSNSGIYPPQNVTIPQNATITQNVTAPENTTIAENATISPNPTILQNATVPQNATNKENATIPQNATTAQNATIPQYITSPQSTTNLPDITITKNTIIPRNDTNTQNPTIPQNATTAQNVTIPQNITVPQSATILPDIAIPQSATIPQITLQNSDKLKSTISESTTSASNNLDSSSPEVDENLIDLRFVNDLTTFNRNDSSPQSREEDISTTPGFDVIELKTSPPIVTSEIPEIFTSASLEEPIRHTEEIVFPGNHQPTPYTSDLETSPSVTTQIPEIWTSTSFGESNSGQELGNDQSTSPTSDSETSPTVPTEMPELTTSVRFGGTFNNSGENLENGESTAPTSDLETSTGTTQIPEISTSASFEEIFSDSDENPGNDQSSRTASDLVTSSIVTTQIPKISTANSFIETDSGPIFLVPTSSVTQMPQIPAILLLEETTEDILGETTPGAQTNSVTLSGDGIQSIYPPPGYTTTQNFPKQKSSSQNKIIKMPRIVANVPKASGSKRKNVDLPDAPRLLIKSQILKQSERQEPAMAKYSEPSKEAAPEPIISKTSEDLTKVHSYPPTLRTEPGFIKEEIQKSNLTKSDSEPLDFGPTTTEVLPTLPAKEVAISILKDVLSLAGNQSGDSLIDAVNDGKLPDFEQLYNLVEKERVDDLVEVEYSRKMLTEMDSNLSTLGETQNFSQILTTTEKTVKLKLLNSEKSTESEMKKMPAVLGKALKNFDQTSSTKERKPNDDMPKGKILSQLGNKEVPEGLEASKNLGQIFGLNMTKSLPDIVSSKVETKDEKINDATISQKPESPGFTTSKMDTNDPIIETQKSMDRQNKMILDDLQENGEKMEVLKNLVEGHKIEDEEEVLEIEDVDEQEVQNIIQTSLGIDKSQKLEENEDEELEVEDVDEEEVKKIIESSVLGQNKRNFVEKDGQIGIQDVDDLLAKHLINLSKINSRNKRQVFDVDEDPEYIQDLKTKNLNHESDDDPKFVRMNQGTKTNKPEFVINTKSISLQTHIIESNPSLKLENSFFEKGQNIQTVPSKSVNNTDIFFQKKGYNIESQPSRPGFLTKSPNIVHSQNFQEKNPEFATNPQNANQNQKVSSQFATNTQKIQIINPENPFFLNQNILKPVTATPAINLDNPFFGKPNFQLEPIRPNPVINPENPFLQNVQNDIKDQPDLGKPVSKPEFIINHENPFFQNDKPISSKRSADDQQTENLAEQYKALESAADLGNMFLETLDQTIPKTDDVSEKSEGLSPRHSVINSQSEASHLKLGSEGSYQKLEENIPEKLAEDSQNREDEIDPKSLVALGSDFFDISDENDAQTQPESLMNSFEDPKSNIDEPSPPNPPESLPVIDVMDVPDMNVETHSNQPEFLPTTGSGFVDDSKQNVQSSNTPEVVSNLAGLFYESLYQNQNGQLDVIQPELSVDTQNVESQSMETVPLLGSFEYVQAEVPLDFSPSTPNQNDEKTPTPPELGINPNNPFFQNLNSQTVTDESPLNLEKPQDNLSQTLESSSPSGEVDEPLLNLEKPHENLNQNLESLSPSGEFDESLLNLEKHPQNSLNQNLENSSPPHTLEVISNLENLFYQTLNKSQSEMNDPEIDLRFETSKLEESKPVPDNISRQSTHPENLSAHNPSDQPDFVKNPEKPATGFQYDPKLEPNEPDLEGKPKNPRNVSKNSNSTPKNRFKRQPPVNTFLLDSIPEMSEISRQNFPTVPIFGSINNQNNGPKKGSRGDDTKLFRARDQTNGGSPQVFVSNNRAGFPQLFETNSPKVFVSTNKADQPQNFDGNPSISLNPQTFLSSRNDPNSNDPPPSNPYLAKLFKNGIRIVFDASKPPDTNQPLKQLFDQGIVVVLDDTKKQNINSLKELFDQGFRIALDSPTNTETKTRLESDPLLKELVDQGIKIVFNPPSRKNRNSLLTELLEEGYRIELSLPSKSGDQNILKELSEQGIKIDLNNPQNSGNSRIGSSSSPLLNGPLRQGFRIVEDSRKGKMPDAKIKDDIQILLNDEEMNEIIKIVLDDYKIRERILNDPKFLNNARKLNDPRSDTNPLLKELLGQDIRVVLDSPSSSDSSKKPSDSNLTIRDLLDQGFRIDLNDSIDSFKFKEMPKADTEKPGGIWVFSEENESKYVEGSYGGVVEEAPVVSEADIGKGLFTELLDQGIVLVKTDGVGKRRRGSNQISGPDRKPIISSRRPQISRTKPANSKDSNPDIGDSETNGNGQEPVVNCEDTIDLRTSAIESRGCSVGNGAPILEEVPKNAQNPKRLRVCDENSIDLRLANGNIINCLPINLETESGETPKALDDQKTIGQGGLTSQNSGSQNIEVGTEKASRKLQISGNSKNRSAFQKYIRQKIGKSGINNSFGPILLANGTFINESNKNVDPQEMALLNILQNMVVYVSKVLQRLPGVETNAGKNLRQNGGKNYGVNVGQSFRHNGGENLERIKQNLHGVRVIRIRRKRNARRELRKSSPKSDVIENKTPDFINFQDFESFGKKLRIDHENAQASPRVVQITPKPQNLQRDRIDNHYLRHKIVEEHVSHQGTNEEALRSGELLQNLGERSEVDRHVMHVSRTGGKSVHGHRQTTRPVFSQQELQFLNPGERKETIVQPAFTPQDIHFKQTNLRENVHQKEGIHQKSTEVHPNKDIHQQLILLADKNLLDAPLLLIATQDFSHEKPHEFNRFTTQKTVEKTTTKRTKPARINIPSINHGETTPRTFPKRIDIGSRFESPNVPVVSSSVPVSPPRGTTRVSTEGVPPRGVVSARKPEIVRGNEKLNQPTKITLQIPDDSGIPNEDALREIDPETYIKLRQKEEARRNQKAQVEHLRLLTTAYQNAIQNLRNAPKESIKEENNNIRENIPEYIPKGAQKDAEKGQTAQKEASIRSKTVHSTSRRITSENAERNPIETVHQAKKTTETTRVLVETAPLFRRPIEPVSSTRRSIETVPPTRKSVETVSVTRRPVETVLTTRRPVETVLTARRPVETVLTARRPVETVLTARRPVETVLTTRRPIVSTTRRPIESVPPTRRPTQTVPTTNQPIQTASRPIPKPTQEPSKIFNFDLRFSPETASVTPKPQPTTSSRPKYTPIRGRGNVRFNKANLEQELLYRPKRSTDRQVYRPVTNRGSVKFNKENLQQELLYRSRRSTDEQFRKKYTEVKNRGKVRFNKENLAQELLYRSKRSANEETGTRFAPIRNRGTVRFNKANLAQELLYRSKRSPQRQIQRNRGNNKHQSKSTLNRHKRQSFGERKRKIQRQERRYGTSKQQERSNKKEKQEEGNKNEKNEEIRSTTESRIIPERRIKYDRSNFGQRKNRNDKPKAVEEKRIKIEEPETPEETVVIPEEKVVVPVEETEMVKIESPKNLRDRIKSPKIVEYRIRAGRPKILGDENQIGRSKTLEDEIKTENQKTPYFETSKSMEVVKNENEPNPSEKSESEMDIPVEERKSKIEKLLEENKNKREKLLEEKKSKIDRPIILEELKKSKLLVDKEIPEEMTDEIETPEVLDESPKTVDTSGGKNESPVERKIKAERQKLLLRNNRGYRRFQMKKQMDAENGLEDTVTKKPLQAILARRNRGKFVYNKKETDFVMELDKPVEILEQNLENEQEQADMNTFESQRTTLSRRRNRLSTTPSPIESTTTTKPEISEPSEVPKSSTTTRSVVRFRTGLKYLTPNRSKTSTTSAPEDISDTPRGSDISSLGSSENSETSDNSESSTNLESSIASGSESSNLGSSNSGSSISEFSSLGSSNSGSPNTGSPHSGSSDSGSSNSGSPNSGSSNLESSNLGSSNLGSSTLGSSNLGSSSSGSPIAPDLSIDSLKSSEESSSTVSRTKPIVAFRTGLRFLNKSDSSSTTSTTTSPIEVTTSRRRLKYNRFLRNKSNNQN